MIKHGTRTIILFLTTLAPVLGVGAEDIDVSRAITDNRINERANGRKTLRRISVVRLMVSVGYMGDFFFPLPPGKHQDEMRETVESQIKQQLMASGLKVETDFRSTAPGLRISGDYSAVRGGKRCSCQISLTDKLKSPRNPADTYEVVLWRWRTGRGTRTHPVSSDAELPDVMREATNIFIEDWKAENKPIPVKAGTK